MGLVWHDGCQRSITCPDLKCHNDNDGFYKTRVTLKTWCLHKNIYCVRELWVLNTNDNNTSCNFRKFVTRLYIFLTWRLSQPLCAMSHILLAWLVLGQFNADIWICTYSYNLAHKVVGKWSLTMSAREGMASNRNLNMTFQYSDNENQN